MPDNYPIPPMWNDPPPPEPPRDMTAEFMAARRQWFERSRQGLAPGPEPVWAPPEPPVNVEPGTGYSYDAFVKAHRERVKALEASKSFDVRTWGK